MSLEKQIERLKYLDFLIQGKRTGTPKELACKLHLSERQTFEIINKMKIMGAPIQYCHQSRSYHYTENVFLEICFKRKNN
ncbi:MAG: hypothetical protein K0S32_148 [Bacteroidetes bacterium]|jgi:hypothetical protein|nr:hypothetical protein [Bacteroidota bacterium]